MFCLQFCIVCRKDVCVVTPARWQAVCAFLPRFLERTVSTLAAGVTSAARGHNVGCFLTIVSKFSHLLSVAAYSRSLIRVSSVQTRLRVFSNNHLVH